MVEGVAYIEEATSGQQRLAEPFGAIRPGDVVVVQHGHVVVCDVRTGVQLEGGDGARLTLAAQPARPTSTLGTRLLEALNALVDEPARTTTAAVRGRPPPAAPVTKTVWPDQVTFGPRAFIHFRWPPVTGPVRFELRRVRPDGALVLETPTPTDPLVWPGDLPRVAGQYEWQLRGGGAAAAHAGSFTILSNHEATVRRSRYAKAATRSFGSANRDLGIELLAAKDGCFFN
jgi:hypothetical protein